MESTDEDIVRQMQVRSAFVALLEKQRLVAVEARCASSSRASCGR
jgi:hypothetical protein